MQSAVLAPGTAPATARRPVCARISTSRCNVPAARRVSVRAATEEKVCWGLRGCLRLLALSMGGPNVELANCERTARLASRSCGRHRLQRHRRQLLHSPVPAPAASAPAPLLDQQPTGWLQEEYDLDQKIDTSKLIDAEGAGRSMFSPGWLTQLNQLWGGKSVRAAV